MSDFKYFELPQLEPLTGGVLNIEQYTGQGLKTTRITPAIELYDNKKTTRTPVLVIDRFITRGGTAIIFSGSLFSYDGRWIQVIIKISLEQSEDAIISVLKEAIVMSAVSPYPSSSKTDLLYISEDFVLIYGAFRSRFGVVKKDETGRDIFYYAILLEQMQGDVFDLTYKRIDIKDKFTGSDILKIGQGVINNIPLDLQQKIFNLDKIYRLYNFLYCCRQIAERISKLHENHIVHVDIKPTNLFFNFPNAKSKSIFPSIKLADLGSGCWGCDSVFGMFSQAIEKFENKGAAASAFTTILKAARKYAPGLKMDCMYVHTIPYTSNAVLQFLNHRNYLAENDQSLYNGFVTLADEIAKDIKPDTKYDFSGAANHDYIAGKMGILDDLKQCSTFSMFVDNDVFSYAMTIKHMAVICSYKLDINNALILDTNYNGISISKFPFVHEGSLNPTTVAINVPLVFANPLEERFHGKILTEDLENKLSDFSNEIKFKLLEDPTITLGSLMSRIDECMTVLKKALNNFTDKRLLQILEVSYPEAESLINLRPLEISTRSKRRLTTGAIADGEREGKRQRQ
jgi:serine/threonine protein kinase